MHKRSNRSFHFIVGSLLVLAAVLSACSTQTAVVQLTISVPDAYEMYQDGVLMLDVRTLEEFQESHIPGATLIPLDQLSARMDEIPRDEPVVVYCRSGNRSLQAVNMLVDAGFSNVQSMDRGIQAWIANGYEVDR